MFLVLCLRISVHVFSIPFRPRAGMSQSRVQCPRPWPGSFMSTPTPRCEGLPQLRIPLREARPPCRRSREGGAGRGWGWGGIHVPALRLPAPAWSSKCVRNTQLAECKCARQFSQPQLNLCSFNRNLYICMLLLLLFYFSYCRAKNYFLIFNSF